MSTERSSVLRFPRSDEPNSFVLMRVVNRGKTSLNLKLVATEGQVPYNATVKQSGLGELRSKNYHGSEDEFAQIISTVLKQQIPGSHANGRIANLEVTAIISEAKDESKELHISIRQRIDNITQRIGNIILRQDDDEIIELFEWTGDAVNTVNHLEHQVVSLNEKLRAKEALVEKMDLQLTELLAAKEQHENHLLTNFVRLVNEKKLKIRNQQRLLASAEVDPKKVATLNAANPASSKRKSTVKRKAIDTQHDVSESDDAFSDIEMEGAHDPEEEGTDDASVDDEKETPQPLEEETASESPDREIEPPPLTQQGKWTGKGDIRASATPSDFASSTSTPPRRHLPFVSKARTRNPTTANPEAADTNSDQPTDEGTDDDEL